MQQPHEPFGGARVRIAEMAAFVPFQNMARRLVGIGEDVRVFADAMADLRQYGVFGVFFFRAEAQIHGFGVQAALFPEYGGAAMKDTI